MTGRQTAFDSGANFTHTRIVHFFFHPRPVEWQAFTNLDSAKLELIEMEWMAIHISGVETLSSFFRDTFSFWQASKQARSFVLNRYPISFTESVTATLSDLFFEK
jgi:hypothetical protein